MRRDFFLLTLFCGINSITYSQITRGASPGELYLSTDWYMDNNGDIHFGIFRSDNNGATINLQYESSTASPSNEMGVGRVLGDATPGALYNYGGELWVSFDYGEDWEFKENLPNTNYLIGNVEGTIFRRIGYELSQSINYGSTFTIVTNPICCPIRESGYYSGEFYGLNGNVGIGLYLDHTLDYANSFTEIPIDSSVAFWAPGGNWPAFSSGTEPGEIYLLSWWLNPNYKIFHSIDTGHTWTEKYESGIIDLFYWRVSYTSGREPGSLFVMRSRINDSGDHVWLYIDYSSDYGETFTTYFHDLDSLFTTVQNNYTRYIELNANPNPFSGSTIIQFSLPLNAENPVLKIYTIDGRLIKEFNISGKDNQTWDGTDFNGKRVESGIYLFSIIDGNNTSLLNKLILIN